MQRRFALPRFGREAQVYLIIYRMEHFVTQFKRLCYRALHVNIIAIALTEGETLKTFAPLVCLLASTALPTLRALERLHFARCTFALSRHERGRLLDMVRPYGFSRSGLTIQARARGFLFTTKAKS